MVTVPCTRTAHRQRILAQGWAAHAVLEQQNTVSRVFRDFGEVVFNTKRRLEVASQNKLENVHSLFVAECLLVVLRVACERDTLWPVGEELLPLHRAIDDIHLQELAFLWFYCLTQAVCESFWVLPQ